MIVDSHAHLDMAQFDGDRHDVIRRALDAGVELIVAIGTGSPQQNSIEMTLALAEKYEFIYAAVGVSPHDARLADAQYWDRLQAWAGHPKVVLWGEIGLDYHYDLSPRDVQKDVFRHQLRIARRRHLPVSIHCRDAWPDLMAILDEEYAGAERGAVLHSFTGTRDQALEGASRGFFISFSGIVTFKNAASLRAAAQALEPEQMLIETDCPYLAPVPHRGRRNEPAFVVETARMLSGFKGMDFTTFAQKTTDNARRLLGLPR